MHLMYAAVGRPGAGGYAAPGYYGQCRVLLIETAGNYEIMLRLRSWSRFYCSDSTKVVVVYS